MEGIRPCPYCGGPVEMVKHNKRENEKREKFRISCYTCHALVAYGEGFPIETKAEVQERIDQYHRYIDNLNGRPNGNSYKSLRASKNNRYQNG